MPRLRPFRLALRLVFTGFLIESTLASDPSLLHTLGGGSPGEDFVSSLRSAPNSEWLAAGRYHGGHPLGPLSLPPPKTNAAWIARLSPTLTPTWIQTLEATAGLTVRSTLADPVGNMFAAGEFSGQFETLRPPRFPDPLPSARGGADAFVAKWNALGTPQWLVRFGGVGNDQALDLAPASDGGCFVTGSFETDADFGHLSLPGNRATHLFTARLSPNGDVAWVRDIAGGESALGATLRLAPDGRLYVGGVFVPDTALLTGPGATGASRTDAFVAVYDLAGRSLRYWAYGAERLDRISSIAATPDSRLVVAGAYDSETRVFRTQVKNQPGLQPIIVFFTPEGELLRLLAPFGPGGGEALSAAVDDSGNAFVCGYFTGSLTFGNVTLRANGIDTFVVKLSPHGDVLWAVNTGETAIVAALQVAVHPSGAPIALGGYFRGDPKFDGQGLVNQGGRDSFLLTFRPPNDPLPLPWKRLPNSLQLTLPTHAGRVQLESASILESRSVWRSVPTPSQPPSTLELPIQPAEPARFFRLRSTYRTTLSVP